MENSLIAVFALLSVTFLLLGVIIGWLVKEQLTIFSYQLQTPNGVHPEMYDENGNIIPDEILAVRFENSEEHDNDEEEDD
tara:strand:+ start:458 stop:697 length:240 start_codon:yes stop_codon:yes gene_type:complete